METFAKKYPAFFVSLFLFIVAPCIADGLPQNSRSQQIKKQMLGNLEFIHDVFEAKYAPLKWKQEYLGWDLDREIEKAKQKTLQLENLTLRDCQHILKDFFQTTQDYHVSIRFFSTEQANLPFLIKGTKGRYFISFVDTEAMKGKLGPAVGDEVLLFNNYPIDKVIQDLKTKEFGEHASPTDQALAEMLLTNRDAANGFDVPFGKATLTVKKKGSERKDTYTFDWSYEPEKILDFTKLGRASSAVRPFEQILASNHYDLKSSIRETGFFKKKMISPRWESQLKFPKVDNSQAIGAKSSFIPALGKKVWKNSENNIFDAYIFLSPTGERIGYIRIPHYMGEDEEVDEFSQIIALFEKQTQALVIDQINNPGGSVFYLYTLASMLSAKPLYAPKHHLALTQEEVNMAITLLPILEMVVDDRSAREVLGETFDGYPIDLEFAKWTQKFCQFIVDEWSKGEAYTKPTFIFGVNEIRPNKTRYTKPILLLINHLCFSGGDFFPAILQDNKRAISMGTRTSGAGGYVMSTRYPNILGIHDFNMTGSLAERIDQTPLENLGVTPDIIYEWTPKDLQDNYSDYVQNIHRTLRDLIKK